MLNNIAATYNSGIVPFNVEYLIAAGGGGAQIGGGGAGGLLNSTVSLFKTTNYSVTVGAGGAGQSGPGTDDATQGISSIFNSITTIGGGTGGGVLGTNETKNGGSGQALEGGGGNSPGAGTSGQGFVRWK